MTAAQIVDKYIKFFEKNGHKKIANSPLVPQNDPTTLFTSSGMQPLVPYLLGETHPQGTRLVNVQNCIRTQDIDEVGNNRHTTIFRMIGNWSLGEYFKEDQLSWFFEFLTNEEVGLGLAPDKLYVTVFGGDERFKVQHNKEKNTNMKPDLVSMGVWKKMFEEKGIEAKVANNGNQEPNIDDGRIFYYGVDKNWWSRSGPPDKMPPGEPGGPDSEVFYDFGTPHDQNFGKYCHPNCDCGRFMEIGNSVFMQYVKQEDGTFKELPKKNVDFGGGLERLLAATNDNGDIFKTSLYSPIIQSISKNLFTKFSYEEDKRVDRAFRIISDHIIAASFLISDGVEPSNKERGYVLRRLIRRAATQNYLWGGNHSLVTIVDSIIEQYKETDPNLVDNQIKIKETLNIEEVKFSKVLKVGRKAWDEWVESHPSSPQPLGTQPFGEGSPFPPIPAEKLFDLFQSQGVPFEFMFELTQGLVDLEGAEKLLKKHQESSKTASVGMFRGGLADHSEKTIMGHTATHLLHQALRDMFGTELHQSGSNITTERLRFDFNYDNKLTDEEIKQLEDVINEKIKENLPVHFEMIPTKDAKEMGAIGLFEDTYQETSKIYFIGGDSKNPKAAYSIEFCGGPHVDFTGKLKSVKIIKQENLGNKMRRLYAVVG